LLAYAFTGPITFLTAACAACLAHAMCPPNHCSACTTVIGTLVQAYIVYVVFSYRPYA
jgi:hypothetical protein